MMTRWQNWQWGQQRLREWGRFGALWGAIALLLGLSACSIPRVNAEDRLFLGLSAELIGTYSLPSDTTFEETQVAGLSAIAYDRQRDRFYALSDDSRTAPPRFYTLKLDLAPEPTDTAGLEAVTVEGVTFLLDEAGQRYAPQQLDPEALALAPQDVLWVASEGSGPSIPPAIGAYDLQTGQLRRTLPLPLAFLPDPQGDEPRGVRGNVGFEALTLNPTGTVASQGEPLRLFAATEASLAQDEDEEALDRRSRFLHYYLGEGPPLVLSSHLYELEEAPFGQVYGLTELAALDAGGHFLALERAFGLGGFGAKLIQIATGGATDISGVKRLQGDITGIEPIRKQELLDLKTLDLRLENLEGMTLGPRLADGSQSLILVSDNNFGDRPTQFLLFRLRAGRAAAAVTPVPAAPPAPVS